MYFEEGGDEGCCSATSAAAGAAAVADSDFSIVLVVLLPSLVLYSRSLFVVAVVGAPPIGVQGGICIVVAVPIAWNTTNDLYELA